jgi:hypothetical protein
MTPDHVSLASLSHEINLCTGGRSPEYRHLYELVISGAVPATRHRGRWYVLRDDIKPIAVMLGILVIAGQDTPGNGAGVRPVKPHPHMSIVQARAALSKPKRTRSDRQSAPA